MQKSCGSNLVCGVLGGVGGSADPGSCKSGQWNVSGVFKGSLLITVVLTGIYPGLLEVNLTFYTLYQN